MFQRRAKFHSLIGLALLTVCAAVAAETHGPFRQVASTDPHWRPKEAHLTLSDALHLAEAEAHRNKVTFAEFEAPWYWFHQEKDGSYTWDFIYEGKVPAPGNHFLVAVNDRTRRAEFVPGE